MCPGESLCEGQSNKKNNCNVTNKGFPLFLNNIEQDLQKLLFFS